MCINYHIFGKFHVLGVAEGKTNFFRYKKYEAPVESAEKHRGRYYSKEGISNRSRTLVLPCETVG